MVRQVFLLLERGGRNHKGNALGSIFLNVSAKKEGLIIRNRPERLGDRKDIARPDVYHEDFIKEMYHQIQLRSEKIDHIPDEEMLMDFHIYEIRMDNGCMEIVIDYNWDIFGVSYSGSKK